MGKIDTDKFKFNGIQEYFFDTSVWLLLFGNVGGYKRDDQKFYSRVFQEIIEKNCCIIITSQVFSELSNVILRATFNNLLKNEGLNPSDYKFKTDFVGSPEYISTVEQIDQIINKIISLKNILRLSDAFSTIDFAKILKTFKQIDFNDSYYLQLLIERNQNTILVSNDADYTKVGTHLDIITNK